MCAQCGETMHDPLYRHVEQCLQPATSPVSPSWLLLFSKCLACRTRLSHCLILINTSDTRTVNDNSGHFVRKKEDREGLGVHVAKKGVSMATRKIHKPARSARWKLLSFLKFDKHLKRKVNEMACRKVSSLLIDTHQHKWSSWRSIDQPSSSFSLGYHTLFCCYLEAQNLDCRRSERLHSNQLSCSMMAGYRIWFLRFWVLEECHIL